MNPDGIHRKTSKLSFHLSLLTQFLVGSAKTNMLIPQQKEITPPQKKSHCQAPNKKWPLTVYSGQTYHISPT